ncbi:hypothetical protein CGLAU_01755 [Corynebacterium glaucum]|uniref:DUF1707 domain-containing protein n=1 Tax=Corynebacterium glaucum TaxID=187491 RepID=A0A1Q2HU18_9CORY|nr:DUF1707 domain-containing protein [Corynebacterium glaucum]AQQ14338.1 hypothetical protein CGLAU_01755 [Corynebacterium glaucum]WJZ06869.1 hypothetical protein CGLAUT_01815 [Corynebacterium glaucum]
MSDANLPRKRAGNADRQHVAAILHDAFSDGQLSLNEFDERTREAWAAVYSDELATLTADLSPVAPVSPVSPVAHSASVAVTRPRSDALSYVTGESGGSGTSISMMGGIDRRGDWHVAPTHTSLTLMGANLLDLRHARLSSAETVINAFACMGGIEIIVPEDVRVVDGGIGIMGGFGIRNDRSCTVRMDQLPADAPVIRVRGMALMGGVEIRRAARNAEL